MAKSSRRTIKRLKRRELRDVRKRRTIRRTLRQRGLFGSSESKRLKKQMKAEARAAEEAKMYGTQPQYVQPQVYQPTDSIKKKKKKNVGGGPGLLDLFF